MSKERFTWDESKRLANIRKHGLGFADAEKVFKGVYVSHVDDRFGYDEIRHVALGLLGGRPISVTYKEIGDEIRIISFRKATKKEQKHFSSEIAYGLGED
jgi:uncharacterized DUF497 family protein